MIYGRCGEPITIVRIAVLEDVQRLEGRKPDKQDREALENGSYVVVTINDAPNRGEVLYHQAYLRTDEGSWEITEAIARLPPVQP